MRVLLLILMLLFAPLSQSAQYYTTDHTLVTLYDHDEYILRGNCGGHEFITYMDKGCEDGVAWFSNSLAYACMDKPKFPETRTFRYTPGNNLICTVTIKFDGD